MLFSKSDNLFLALVLLGLLNLVLSEFNLQDPDPDVHTGSTTLEQLTKTLEQLRADRKALQQQTLNITGTITTLQTLVSDMEYQLDNLPTTPAPTTAKPTTTTESSFPDIAQAFEGKLTEDVTNYAMSSNVYFGKVITNVGDPYDTTTGTFHCTQRGLYLFSITLYADGPASLDVYLNNVVVMRPSVGLSNDETATSEVAVATARKGDSVRVKFGHVTDGTILKETRFSAVFLQKLD